jgi:hypothetical protein
MPHVKEIRTRESLKLRLLVVPSLLDQIFSTLGLKAISETISSMRVVVISSPQ